METKSSVATFRTLSLTFTCHIWTQNQCKSAKSHCRNEGSIINLGVMIVAFEYGHGAKFNIQV